MHLTPESPGVGCRGCAASTARAGPSVIGAARPRSGMRLWFCLLSSAVSPLPLKRARVGTEQNTSKS